MDSQAVGEVLGAIGLGCHFHDPGGSLRLMIAIEVPGIQWPMPGILNQSQASAMA